MHLPSFNWNLKQMWQFLFPKLRDKPKLEKMKTQKYRMIVAQLPPPRTHFIKKELTLHCMKLFTHKKALSSPLLFNSGEENLSGRFFSELLHNRELQILPFSLKRECRVLNCGNLSITGIRRWKNHWCRLHTESFVTITSMDAAIKMLCLKRHKIHLIIRAQFGRNKKTWDVMSTYRASATKKKLFLFFGIGSHMFFQHCLPAVFSCTKRMGFCFLSHNIVQIPVFFFHFFLFFSLRQLTHGIVQQWRQTLIITKKWRIQNIIWNCKFFRDLIGIWNWCALSFSC